MRLGAQTLQPVPLFLIVIEVVFALLRDLSLNQFSDEFLFPLVLVGRKVPPEMGDP